MSCIIIDRRDTGTRYPYVTDDRQTFWNGTTHGGIWVRNFFRTQRIYL